jgi:hypothetical protein
MLKRAPQVTAQQVLGAAGGGAASSATTIWLACWLTGGATWEH